jgi:acetyl-CoA C-acetyltransferase
MAIPRALKMADRDLEKVEIFEINEAFASVLLANTKILGIDESRVNLWGGAISIGHPLGA